MTRTTKRIALLLAAVAIGAVLLTAETAQAGDLRVRVGGSVIRVGARGITTGGCYQSDYYRGDSHYSSRPVGRSSHHRPRVHRRRPSRHVVTRPLPYSSGQVVVYSTVPTTPTVVVPSRPVTTTTTTTTTTTVTTITPRVRYVR